MADTHWQTKTLVCMYVYECICVGVCVYVCMYVLSLCNIYLCRSKDKPAAMEEPPLTPSSCSMEDMQGLRLELDRLNAELMEVWLTSCATVGCA